MESPISIRADTSEPRPTVEESARAANLRPETLGEGKGTSILVGHRESLYSGDMRAEAATSRPLNFRTRRGLSKMQCLHNADACCWLCSNDIEWWKTARVQAGLGNNPPNAPMLRARLNEETVSLPNYLVAGCEKSAVGPRGMCGTHYSKALAELHRWEAQNALRRAAAAGRI